MKKLNERLDDLRGRIQEEDFLTGKGLSNEVGIHIFCYDAAEEMMVQHFVDQLVKDSSLSCRLIECDLYRIFLEICNDMDIIEEAVELEETDGAAYLMESLESAANAEAFIEKMQYAPHQHGDILLLTGVGNVFPFMRVHSLLEALQPNFSDIPIVVLYPGKYTGRYVQLFDRLKPHDYYRAFNLI